MAASEVEMDIEERGRATVKEKNDDAVIYTAKELEDELLEKGKEHTDVPEEFKKSETEGEAETGEGLTQLVYEDMSLLMRTVLPNGNYMMGCGISTRPLRFHPADWGTV